MSFSRRNKITVICFFLQEVFYLGLMGFKLLVMLNQEILCKHVAILYVALHFVCFRYLAFHTSFFW